jgi:ATP-dependent protease ClpP protease subunit
MTDVIELFNGLAELKIRGGHEWYRFQNAAGSDEATVEIYDEIGMWGITAADFAAALDALPKSTKTINLRINSPGGGVFAGLAIATRLRAHPATVNVTVDGVAASIASVIAMSGDTVTMARGSTMMIHDPSGLVMGTADDMEQMAAVLRKLARDSIADAYMAKAGGTQDGWLARMKDETWYSGTEAVAAGLADATEGQDEDEPEDRAGFDLTAYGFLHAGRDAAPDPAVTERARRSAQIRARHNARRQEARGK